MTNGVDRIWEHRTASMIGLVGLVMGLTGCSADSGDPPSARRSATAPQTTSPAAPTTTPESVTAEPVCLDAMQAAAAEPDPAAADPLIVATLSACSTAAAWLDALRAHPAAMGLSDQAEIGRLELRASCYGNEATPVCADAQKKGWL
ncbi:hypothetical protein [Jiangella mangrovi]|uniref:Lipoprotein n=1 Tax=Jiangella mangrovi TaxID=1524084 RepID=A0A7W9GNQ9_9ACTN|nr:hypothetical protein [Jiangella mangrovi]MBB5787232.1 hypothetical protein [Jiangella mangrovi]